MLAAALGYGIVGLAAKLLAWVLIAFALGGPIGAVAGGWIASAPRPEDEESATLFSLGRGGVAALSTTAYDGAAARDDEAAPMAWPSRL